MLGQGGLEALTASSTDQAPVPPAQVRAGLCLAPKTLGSRSLARTEGDLQVFPYQPNLIPSLPCAECGYGGRMGRGTLGGTQDPVGSLESIPGGGTACRPRSRAPEHLLHWQNKINDKITKDFKMAITGLYTKRRTLLSCTGHMPLHLALPLPLRRRHSRAFPLRARCCQRPPLLYFTPPVSTESLPLGHMFKFSPVFRCLPTFSLHFPLLCVPSFTDFLKGESIIEHFPFHVSSSRTTRVPLAEVAGTS